MAKTIARSKDSALYESDFPLWLERQVGLLRAGGQPWKMKTDTIEPEILPDACPFTLNQILDRDWLPTNVYDLDPDQA